MCVLLRKMWENGPFFQAATAGLVKYRMGSYGQVGVYRVNNVTFKEKQKNNLS